MHRPDKSTAESEKMLKQRGPTFILVTNLVLSFGTPFSCIIYLIVFQAAGGLNANLSTVWRTVFGISAIPPAVVFYFRIKMLNSQLYRKSAIQTNVPYLLMIRFYWKTIIGYAISSIIWRCILLILFFRSTAGAWFLCEAILKSRRRCGLISRLQQMTLSVLACALRFLSATDFNNSLFLGHIPERRL